MQSSDEKYDYGFEDESGSHEFVPSGTNASASIIRADCSDQEQVDAEPLVERTLSPPRLDLHEALAKECDYSPEDLDPYTWPDQATQGTGDERCWTWPGEVGSHSENVSVATMQRRLRERLEHAKSLAKHAKKHVLEDDAMHAGQRDAEVICTISKVQRTIQKRIGHTDDLVRALEDRIESVEDTIRQCGECLFTLQRAFRSKSAPLNVCERRLELRNARPVQEMVRDRCQELLEAERLALIEARQELSQIIEGMKEHLVALDRAKCELLEELQRKRHALRHDRSTLSARGKVRPTSGSISGNAPQQTGDRVVLPALRDVTTPMKEERESHQAENTRALISAVLRLEEETMRLMNEGDASMAHTKQECAEATEKARSTLRRWVGEMTTLKQQLEAQMRATDEIIAQTGGALQKTKKRIMLHDQPMRYIDQQLDIRDTNRKDPLYQEMVGQKDVLKRSVTRHAGKFEATAKILEQLKASKKQLQEDIHLKAAALKLDDACLRLTPRKAIELDRQDPRGGRVSKPNSRQQTAEPKNFNPNATF